MNRQAFFALPHDFAFGRLRAGDTLHWVHARHMQAANSTPDIASDLTLAKVLIKGSEEQHAHYASWDAPYLGTPAIVVLAVSARAPSTDAPGPTPPAQREPLHFILVERRLSFTRAENGEVEQARIELRYALSVAGALFRWLIQQRYVLANPFAGIKVRGASSTESSALTRVFSEGEWGIVQAVAVGLEWMYGWEPAAAQRLRFVLDFSYATGLRIGELVSARLGQLETDGHGDHWLRLMSKGGKIGKVALPSLARSALDRYLMQRQLTTTPSRWNPKTPLVGSLDPDSDAGITATRIWNVMRRFFTQVAEVIEADSPALAEKLRRASPHWMRHTHATHALARGAELITVRDNLRHASITTTSLYLHGDEVNRARQMDAAFAARDVQVARR